MEITEQKIPSSVIIAQLGLQPNEVEGGYFASTYPEQGTTDSPCSAIYYFLDETSPISVMHMVTGDMLYHFYAGDPVEMLLLYPKGHCPATETITFSNDIGAGGRPMKVIPGGTWLGSKIKCQNHEDSWSLMGVSMAPPFNPEEYFLGNREELIALYPEQEQRIIELTRES